jgi:hypothetical protein
MDSKLFPRVLCGTGFRITEEAADQAAEIIVAQSFGSTSGPRCSLGTAYSDQLGGEDQSGRKPSRMTLQHSLLNWNAKNAYRRT